jgi:hypothetical protein
MQTEGRSLEVPDGEVVREGEDCFYARRCQVTPGMYRSRDHNQMVAHV